VSAMHITAGVYVNDNEEGLIEDIDRWLEKLAPRDPDYKHHQTGETNGDAHLKSMLVHHQVIVPVTAGQLDLGPWQRVFYAEFDGRRDKRVLVKVIRRVSEPEQYNSRNLTLPRQSRIIFPQCVFFVRPSGQMKFHFGLRYLSGTRECFEVALRAFTVFSI